MNKLSEDEKKAIDMLEKYITEHKFYNIKQSDGLEDNIKMLLDLYKQEKEKIEAMNKGIDELVREKQDLKTELYMNSVSKDKIRGIFNNKIMKEKENLEQILMEENINKAFITNAIESKISEFKKLEKQLLEEE